MKAARSTETGAVIAAIEGLTIDNLIGKQTMRASDHQASCGMFWRQMTDSNIEGYPDKILQPVEYIAANSLMD